MRFLCLHGAGTNSKIFEAQTAALRYELGGNHTYEFVEGHIPQPQAPAIERFATSGDEYYAYYIPGSHSSFTTAKAHLQAYVETEGPFDGVIAFSQGASLASALLLGDEHAQTLPFRCAILICGRLPMTDERSLCSVMGAGKESLQKEDEENVENDDDNGVWDCKERQIRVPTVHILAANDPIDPGHAKALWTCCNAAVRWECVHELGHEVPGARDQEVLVESVNAIRRMLGAVGSTC